MEFQPNGNLEKNSNRKLITSIIIILFLIIIIGIGFIIFKNGKSNNDNDNLANVNTNKEEINHNIEGIDNSKENGKYNTIQIKKMEKPKKDGDSKIDVINGIRWQYDLDTQGNAINLRAMDILENNVEIPNIINGHKVISIGREDSSNKAGIVYTPEGIEEEYSKNVTSITIPKGVLYINEQAFYGMKQLENITLPDTIIYIGDAAFANTQNLSKINSSEEGSIILPKNLQYYGESIFEANDKINKFTFPEQISYINKNTFNKCKGFNETLEINGQYQYILEGAFSNNENTKNLKINEGVKYIGANSFENNASLKEVQIADTVEYIGTEAFSKNNAIESFRYNGKLKYLGSNIFKDTKININKFISNNQLD